MKKLIIIIALLLIAAECLPQYRIGTGKSNITPAAPVWLSGYASRTKPSEGKLNDLWVKALVIEQGKKHKAVIVTADIIGFTHELSQDIIRTIVEKHNLERSQILINSSHTHSGPVIWPGLSLMYGLRDSDLLALVSYSVELRSAVLNAVDSAFGNLTAGQIETGHGTAAFAINRRQESEKGVVIGLNPSGPVDHDVPVIKFSSISGETIAVLFGYACHNTTLSGYEINGDYAGFAQAELERMYPGTMAMYMAGCGADQNPEPRRAVEHAERHGQELATAVSGVLEGNLERVQKRPVSAFTTAELEFPAFNPERFRKELEDKDVYRKRRAVFLLEAYDRGYDLDRLSYPVQVVRFGRDLSILALAGEVVVDYSLQAKKRYPRENLFVAGYCSEVPCYIPTVRIIKEGGYEPDNSMIYYGLPGPFSDNVEEKITAAIHRVMRKAGAKEGH
jgi:neutral ceramidase